MRVPNRNPNRRDGLVPETSHRVCIPSRRLRCAGVFLLCITILFVGPVSGASSPLEGVDGTGTEANPYVITDVDELQAIGDEPDAHYVLGNDIDASETRAWNGYAGFDPIASDGEFTGSLDGQNYEIRSLVVDRPDEDRVGLFANANGTIENVNLEETTVVGNQDVGGLVGAAHEAAVIRRISVTGEVTGDHEVGGLAGRSAGTVMDSVSEAELAADDENRRSFIGGLVGLVENGSVERSAATGDVTGIRAVGGLVGVVSYDAYVSDSYATGDVTGVDHEDSGYYFGWEDSFTVGGLVAAVDGSVATSFSTGEVTGTRRYHGLFGEHKRVVDSYWDVDASGHEQGSLDSDDDMTGLTTAEMTGPEAAENTAALDFDSVFKTTPDSYPILRAELEPAEFRVTELDGPDALEVGETAEVSATIKNVGALEGTQNVSLTLGDTTEQSTSLTLGPDERETMVLELTAAVDGDQQYTVKATNDATVDGLASNALTVTDETDDTGAATDSETQSSSDGLPGFGAVGTVVALVVVTTATRLR